MCQCYQLAMFNLNYKKYETAALPPPWLFLTQVRKATNMH